MEAKTRTVVTPVPIDLRSTFHPFRRGNHDPTLRFTASGLVRATRTPEGPAAHSLEVRDDRVSAEAWGPGAGWLLEHLGEIAGAEDDLTGFEPEHEVVRDATRQLPGLRINRSLAVFEVIFPTVLEQKVTGLQAARSYLGLVRAFGEPAPGPWGLTLPPAPEVLAALPYHRYHLFDVERARAERVRSIAAEAPRLQRYAELPPEEAGRRLELHPGIGPWTAAHVRRLALGDPDAVEVGDYHLKNTIAWHFTGRRKGTDEEMLATLAPYRGHRGRVVRLVETGAGFAPRRGPRLSADRIAGY